MVNTFMFPPICPENTSNILHIHIRSGDIMKPDQGADLVQPPCAYYEDEIIRHDWEKVIIVSEDRANPCIDYLVGKYENVHYFGVNSLEHDITELLSATNIMIGRGTFIQALSVFMPNLKNIHYPTDGDYRMHYFLETMNPDRCIRHDEYKDYYDQIDEMGGWKCYNERIGDLIMNFRK